MYLEREVYSARERSILLERGLFCEREVYSARKRSILLVISHAFVIEKGKGATDHRVVHIWLVADTNKAGNISSVTKVYNIMSLEKYKNPIFVNMIIYMLVIACSGMALILA